MRTARLYLALLTALVLLPVPLAPVAADTRCPADAAAVGTLCADKYEASVWRIPPGKNSLIKRVQRGTVTLDDLRSGGATQLCPVPLGNEACESCSYGDTFPDTGNWTDPLYAVSIPGVLPSSCITWFQAEQACRLSGKRLLTNQEWQAAAAGTPDPGDADDGVATCTTNSAAPSLAGARTSCVSSWGTHDMVGNVWEWVGNWLDIAQGESCATWGSAFGDDIACLGPNTSQPPSTATVQARKGSRSRRAVVKSADIFPVSPQIPGALIRGGNFAVGSRNGVFAIYAGAPPHNRSRSTGFRCAR